jgi:integrase
MATIEKRTSNDGSVSYRVKIRVKGYPTETATFERKTDAGQWAQQTEADIRRGKYFKNSESKKHTLKEMLNRYKRDVLPQKKSERDQKRQLDWWIDQIGDYTLADITSSLISEYRDKLKNERLDDKEIRGPSTVNRYLAALSHAFTIAMKDWGWVEDNPVLKVSKFKEPRGRVRFLDEDERKRLLDACKKHSDQLYTIVVLALSSGARQSEILNLRWKDIDLDRGIIVLHETKNDERRAIPLQGHALDLINGMSKVRMIDSDLLFPSPTKNTRPVNIQHIWEDARTEAKIDNFRFHDLRHSAASYLAMSGASLAEIADVLGHKTLQMVKRYTHLSEQHTAGVVAKMNDAIFGTK